MGEAHGIPFRVCIQDSCQQRVTGVISVTETQVISLDSPATRRDAPQKASDWCKPFFRRQKVTDGAVLPPTTLPVTTVNQPNMPMVSLHCIPTMGSWPSGGNSVTSASKVNLSYPRHGNRGCVTTRHPPEEESQEGVLPKVDTKWIVRDHFVGVGVPRDHEGPKWVIFDPSK